MRAENERDEPLPPAVVVLKAGANFLIVRPGLFAACRELSRLAYVNKGALRAPPLSARGLRKENLAGRASYRRSPGHLAKQFKASGIAMSDEKLRALPRDTPDYHARQAAHLRALAENATTAPAEGSAVRGSRETRRACGTSRRRR